MICRLFAKCSQLVEAVISVDVLIDQLLFDTEEFWGHAEAACSDAALNDCPSRAAGNFVKRILRLFLLCAASLFAVLWRFSL